MSLQTGVWRGSMFRGLPEKVDTGIVLLLSYYRFKSKKTNLSHSSVRYCTHSIVLGPKLLQKWPSP